MNKSKLAFQVTAGSTVSGSTKQRNLASRDAMLFYSIFEFVVASIAGFLSLQAYTLIVLGSDLPTPESATPAVVLGAAIVGCSIAAEHYVRLLGAAQSVVIRDAFVAALHGFCLLLLFLFFFNTGSSLSHGGMAVQIGVVTVLIAAMRGVFGNWVRRAIRMRRLVVSRTMIIGEASRLIPDAGEDSLLGRLRDEGAEIVHVRHLSADHTPADEAGFVASAVDACRVDEIDSVVLLPSIATMATAERLAAALSTAPVTVHVIPFARLPGSLGAGYSHIAGQPAIVIRRTALGAMNRVLKRGFDIFGASIALLMLLPVMICVAVAIRLESPGPVLFRQTRHGLGNSLFRVYKFRSMRVMEDGAAFRQATKGDARITRVGHVIRRTNLDELPQLFNVMLGDMSLVGPRPHPVALNDDFASRIQLYNRRHNILPGITGWAQINGHRGATDESQMRHRVEHDIWYVDNWSLALDLRILLMTVFSPVAYKNAG